MWKLCVLSHAGVIIRLQAQPPDVKLIGAPHSPMLWRHARAAEHMISASHAANANCSTALLHHAPAI